jgi:uncharacterized protein YrrD
MLVAGDKSIGTPIMSLQTGGCLAHTKKPVIDPSNLEIVAFELEGALLNMHPSYLRVADIREVSPIGFIVNDSDEFVSSTDVIKIKKILELNFELLKLPVIDELKHKLGRISNFNLDTIGFSIQQLIVNRSIIHSFSDSELIIHRDQIIEVSDNFIKVRTTAQKLAEVGKTNQMDFLNPFRGTSAQPESSPRQN